MRFVKLLLFLIISFSSVGMTIPNPIKTLAELGDYIEEEAVMVTSTRVILADYPLIRRDFENLAFSTQKEIDDWLLGHAGYIAKTQAQMGVKRKTNKRIRFDIKQRIRAYRPPMYGRALVFSTPNGLIDAKGAGALMPRIGGHTNGLAELEEMITEFMYEKLTNLVLKDFGHGDTIESYAVIDYGFDLIIDAQPKRAGQILRQAHVRQIYSEIDNELRIEKVLRKYGLSSAGLSYAPGLLTHTFLNVQYSMERALVDFGCFFIADYFPEALVDLDYKDNPDPSLIYIDPKDNNAVQPDPGLQLSVENWGYRLEDGSYNCNLYRVAKDMVEELKDCHDLSSFQKVRHIYSHSLFSALREQKESWRSKRVRLKPEAKSLMVDDSVRPPKRIRGANGRLTTEIPKRPVFFGG